MTLIVPPLKQALMSAPPSTHLLGSLVLRFELLSEFLRSNERLPK